MFFVCENAPFSMF
jgi:hypothetical protein